MRIGVTNVLNLAADHYSVDRFLPTHRMLFVQHDHRSRSVGSVKICSHSRLHFIARAGRQRSTCNTSGGGGC